MEPKINELELILVDLGFEKISCYCKDGCEKSVSGCKKKNCKVSFLWQRRKKGKERELL
jgi:hypothetical protein